MKKAIFFLGTTAFIFLAAPVLAQDDGESAGPGWVGITVRNSAGVHDMSSPPVQSNSSAAAVNVSGETVSGSGDGQSDFIIRRPACDQSLCAIPDCPRGKRLVVIPPASNACCPTHRCEDEADCSAIYKPVCAQPQWCPNGSADLACPAAMPEPRTFSNACEMGKAKAKFIHDGPCEGDNSRKRSCSSNSYIVKLNAGNKSTKNDLINTLRLVGDVSGPWKHQIIGGSAQNSPYIVVSFRPISRDVNRDQKDWDTFLQKLEGLAGNHVSCNELSEPITGGPHPVEVPPADGGIRPPVTNWK